MAQHVFASDNSPAWNEHWNLGYEDCSDPHKGRLVSKPATWHPMLWEAYCDGCYWFDSDSRSMADASNCDPLFGQRMDSADLGEC